MIFGSIGLLLVAGGLLAAGIANSSTGFLALSLVCTVAAGMLLIVAYAAARGATGLNTGRAAGSVDGFVPPGTPPGVVYVPMTAVPAGAAQEARGANGNAPGPLGLPVIPPILGYDEMTAEQVAKLVTSGALGQEQLAAVRDYEAQHESRKTVLDRVDRALR